MRTITVEERRARLVRRHLLICRAGRPAEVARAVVALHSTDPASVILSLWARLREPALSAIEDALYEERSLVRLQGMRRTPWVVPRDLAGVVFTAVGGDLQATERRTLTRMLVEGGVTEDSGGWMACAARP